MRNTGNFDDSSIDQQNAARQMLDNNRNKFIYMQVQKSKKKFKTSPHFFAKTVHSVAEMYEHNFEFSFVNLCWKLCV